MQIYTVFVVQCHCHIRGSDVENLFINETVKVLQIQLS